MIDPEQLRKALLEHLQSLRASGVTHLPAQDWSSLLATPAPALSNLRPASATVAENPPLPGRTPYRPATTDGPTPTLPPPQQAPSGSPPTGRNLLTQPDLSPYGLQLALAERPAALEVLQAEVAACRCCPELVCNRRQTVFGVGAPQARLCFLGEAPGQEEDAQGEPFVGAAGQLLDKIISACKLSRAEVYILNTVKCRPPMNRTPSDGEVQNCWHFAHQQLEIIQPEFICCLGSVAAKSLLQTGKSIAQLRGTFHLYRGSRVIVTYHPAYLLRTPSAKRHVWDDMKLLMRELGVEL